MFINHVYINLLKLSGLKCQEPFTSRKGIYNLGILNILYNLFTFKYYYTKVISVEQ